MRCPILLITCTMITDWMGLHSVLLPLLIGHKQIFYFSRRRTSQNLAFFCKSISIFLSRSLLFLYLSSLLAVLLLTLSSFFWMELWLANFLGKGQISLQREGKQRNWQWIFPENVTFFCECNSVRVGQNIQDKVSLERSLFTDIVAKQFNLNWKLNGSRKENMHCSIWNENNQSSRQRISCVCNKSEIRSPFLNPDHWLLITHITNIHVEAEDSWTLL